VIPGWLPRLENRSAKTPSGTTNHRLLGYWKGIATALAGEYPIPNARQSVALQSLTERSFAQLRPALLCTRSGGLRTSDCLCHVANLQLARATRGRASLQFARRWGRGEAAWCGCCWSRVYCSRWRLSSSFWPWLRRTDRVKSDFAVPLSRSQSHAHGGVLTFALVVSLLTSLLFGFGASTASLTTRSARNDEPRRARIRAGGIAGERR